MNATIQPESPAKPLQNGAQPDPEPVDYGCTHLTVVLLGCFDHEENMFVLSSKSAAPKEAAKPGQKWPEVARNGQTRPT